MVESARRERGQKKSRKPICHNQSMGGCISLDPTTEMTIPKVKQQMIDQLADARIQEEADLLLHNLLLQLIH